MPLAITKRSAQQAIGLDVLKDHLNLQGNDRFDRYLKILIEAIPEPASKVIGQTLLKTTYQWTIEEFMPFLCLPRPPLLEVLKVECRKTTGWEEIGGNNFEFNSNAATGFVQFKNGYRPPEADEDIKYPWRFTYTAGYIDEDGESGPEQVPANIRLWIMDMIGSQFMKREADMLASGSVTAEYLEHAMGRLIARENRNRHFG